MESNIKNIRDLISGVKEVKYLADKSHKSDSLQRILQQVLPSLLADYCRVRSFEQGLLTLDAATGSAATQLRFVTQQILPKLKKHSIFRDLEKIQIRIQAPEPDLKAHKTRYLPAASRANCQLIQDTANNIQDIELADSLRKLATTLSKNGKD